MLNILIASSNPGKLREIQAVLSQESFHLLLPAHVGLALEVVESGATYAENAQIKALAYARASGMLSLADDSGLELAALDGAPGIYSARYHPLPGATDAQRRQYLLANLQSFSQPWHACFHCSVAIATPAGEVYSAQGECSGFIIPEERGTGGFGYDPIFFLPELGLTMAELPEAYKNQISHRARALQAALPILRQLANREGRINR
jgi:XTP/dITP diphosphohydrolase